MLYEIGYAQAVEKPLILVAQETSKLPFDVAEQRVILYGTDFEKGQHLLRKSISVVLSKDRLDAATRLYEIGQHRGSIAAAAVVLEHKLRNMLGKYPPEKFSRMSLGQMLNTAKKRRRIKGLLGKNLSEVVRLRNRAVHEVEEPSQEDAQIVLNSVSEFFNLFPDKE